VPNERWEEVGISEEDGISDEDGIKMSWVENL